MIFVMERILPVAIMLLAGVLARKLQMITDDQKEGVKQVIFQILFPILVFNAMFSAQFKREYVLAVLYVFLIYCLAFLVGILLKNWHGLRFSHISPYLLPTVEGGNVGIPLYLALVGSGFTINMVMFDPASLIFTFVVIPILVARDLSQKVSLRELIIKVIKSPLIITIIIGIVLHEVGLYDYIQASQISLVYSSAITMMTAPIGSMILFCLGYELQVDKAVWFSVVKLMITRILFYAVVIMGFFVFFKDMTKHHEFNQAIILYFMCPTGFLTPLLISDLCKDEEDRGYVSAFVSMYILVTITVFVILSIRG